MATRPVDNQHLGLKVSLRERCIAEADIQTLIVCETHGGFGKLGQLCYGEATLGMVVEKDAARASALARQRPTWRVYCADSAEVFAEGLGAEIAFTVLDCDPYGQCWPTLTGFFQSSRRVAEHLAVIATDGARQKMRLGGFDMRGWEPWQDRFGPNLWDVYLLCCRERFTGLVVQAGYTVTWWHGQYSRTGQQTYFAAALRRPSATCSDEAQPRQGASDARGTVARSRSVYPNLGDWCPSLCVGRRFV